MIEFGDLSFFIIDLSLTCVRDLPMMIEVKKGDQAIRLISMS